MTLARGGIGGGRTAPTAPTNVVISPYVVNNGSNPRFTVTFSASTPSSKASISSYLVSFYYVVGVTPYLEYQYQTSDLTSTASGTSLVAGRVYYATVIATDSFGINSTASANSASRTALTRPADVGTITISGGINTVNASWNNVNAGGDSSVTYSWQLVNTSGNTVYTSGSGSATSFSLTGVPAGTYYAKVSASNSSFTQFNLPTTSSNVTVVAPPFFPFFPSFGPFFPSFGPYFPSFGPSFPRFMFY